MLDKKVTNRLIKSYTNNVPLEASIFVEGQAIKEDNLTTVSQLLTYARSPNYMDSNHFWKKAVKNFPSFSIAGSDKFENVDEINEATTHNLHLRFNMIREFLNDCYRSNKGIDLLEIGPGFGGMYHFFRDNLPNIWWRGIDVNCLFKHPNLYRTNGHQIPEKVPSMDVIYSINVFQHLSNEQRQSYYTEAYNKLREGGTFIFGMFAVTDENEHEVRPNGNRLFGVKDEDGTYYSTFLSQLTPVDRLEEAVNKLLHVGFKDIIVDNISNYYIFKGKK